MTTRTYSPIVLHTLRLLVVATVILAPLTGCDIFDSDDAPDPLATAFSDAPITVPFFIEDENGEMPTDPDALLYEIRKHAPVIAPDGHHVTWAEFSTVQGTAKAECLETGTHVSLDLSGLIPDGVYTIWNVTFHAPGMDPAREMLNIRGVGALGRGDGSQNYVIASPQGTAQISAATPGGPLSMMGDIAACPLTDELEWHVVGAYHMDGKSHGPMLGPDGTAAEQFGFLLKTP